MSYGESAPAAARGKLLVTALLAAVSLASAQTTFPEVADYCDRDRFNPQCRENEAIVVRYAKFGRMRRGPCIGDSGIFGCSIDVKVLLDERCSGRRSCDVAVVSLVPESQQPCDRTYRSYLEAAYLCVPVAYASPELCTGPLEVRAPLGYLSSAVAEQTGCGALDSPWFVTVQPGQRIQFTLMDFRGRTTTAGHQRGTTGKVCHVYAVIKEDGVGAGGMKRTETVCSTAGDRERPVYTSQGHMAEVRLVVRAQDDDDNHFLLKYTALGCADIPAPRGGWVRRLAGGGDEAVVGCNATGQTYHVTCDGSTWRGAWNNCTQLDIGSIASAVQTEWSIFSQSHGVSVFVIVCIAVAVGFLILLAGLLYLKRRARNHVPRQTAPPDDMYSYQQKVGHFPATSQYAVRKGGHRDSRHAKMAEPGFSFSQSENDYYKTWQIQQRPGVPGVGTGQPPLPPPPPYSDSSVGSSSYNRAAAEHIYESPKFVRKSQGSTEDYYELDLDDMSRVHT